MNKLPTFIGHPELVSQIVGQFVFMILMSSGEDHNFVELNVVDINTVFKKADSYFLDYTDDLGMIDTIETKMDQKIKKFLSEWRAVVDVEAIQQNVHNGLRHL